MIESEEHPEEFRLMEKRPTRTELRSQVDAFAAHCRAHGLSVTSQRLAIFEALRAIGAVADVNPLHEQGRYEAALPGTGAGRPHHHLVCVQCKDVRDLHDPGLEGLQVSDLQGFEVRALKVQVEGICPRCAAIGAPRVALRPPRA